MSVEVKSEIVRFFSADYSRLLVAIGSTDPVVCQGSDAC